MKKEPRSAKLFSNVTPSLKKKIQADARKRKWTDSALIEEIIIQHYAG